ncbi:MAG: CoA transferase [Anaerolineae bacterium]|nr:CoA transferase [Anaerolineae bacterium]
MTPTPLPLHGVRVLDFTRVLAGPFCTMLLADLGADVIKIEEPARGDETRQWGPPWAGEGDDALSAYYLCANRNKRSLTLNLKHERAQAIARELAATSQVVIENFKPGGMAAYGLDYEALSALNPALVYCSITGFGQTGPYSERPGYDFVIQAMSGLMSITGPVEGEPSKVGVAVTDVLAGLFAATSILAALRLAEQTGHGQRLDVSLLDASLASLVNVASNALVSGTAPARYGNAHPNIVPYQTFRANDGDFALAVGNDRQFAALCRLLDHPEWAEDERFATNPARVRYRDELIASLQAIFVTRPAMAWVDALLALGIPCGPVNDVTAILRDPHVMARGLVQQVALANGSSAELVGHPVKFSQTPPQVRTPPPLHGADTEKVLSALLNLDQDEIAQLRTEGVI